MNFQIIHNNQLLLPGQIPMLDDNDLHFSKGAGRLLPIQLHLQPSKMFRDETWEGDTTQIDSSMLDTVGKVQSISGATVGQDDHTDTML